MDAGLWVRFKGVVGIRDTDWLQMALGISVLTGANNVGKSRLLRLVYNLRTARSQPTSQGSLPEIKVVTGDITVEADISGSVSPTRYVSSESEVPRAIARWDGGALWNELNEAAGRMGYGGPPVSFETAMQGWHGYSQVSDALNRLVYVDPQRRIEDNFNTEPVEVPNPNGADLGNMIFTHRSKSTAEFAELTEIMSELFQEIGEIRTIPLSRDRLQLQIFDRYAGIPVPLNAAGTGVAQSLFFCALVLMSPPGQTFLIDEPHVYLHPKAEKLLAKFIVEHDEHSYVVATHSPILVDALSPQRVWLVTRDEAGTAVNEVFKGSLSRRSVLTELGIEPGDVALYRRVLFVEGKDPEIYSHVLRKLGWDPLLNDCTILGLQGGDLSQALQRIVNRLGELMISHHMIYLDGDKKRGVSESDRLKFLPYPEVEDLLLRDPAAVRSGLIAVREETSPATPEPWESEWSTERIAKLIADLREKHPGDKGSGIMRRLTHELGPFEYQKTVHGPKIAEFLSSSAVERLHPQFEQFFA